MLGKCILALTMRAAGSKIHVPFRDSTLTFLLKESLQGNSRTFMVRAFSPDPKLCSASDSALSCLFCVYVAAPQHSLRTSANPRASTSRQ